MKLKSYGNVAIGMTERGIPVYARLGFTPAASRSVRSMPSELKSLVGPPVDKNIQLKVAQPDVEKDTMPAIISKIKRTSYQVTKLAAKLKGSSLAQTLRNDSDFILKYIKYKEDDTNNEQLRSPRRLISDGYGDCDCFAVTLGALLREQKINFILRIASYDRTPDDWSHIYVIVPKNQSSSSVASRSDYTVLDPVTNQHDTEAPYAYKKDYTMKGLNGLQSLDGLGDIPNLSNVPRLGGLAACSIPGNGDTAKDERFKKLRRFISTSEVEMLNLVPTEKWLAENKIPYEAKVDPSTNTGYMQVQTANGPVNVNTILTKTELAQLKTMLASSAPVADVAPNVNEADDHDSIIAIEENKTTVQQSADAQVQQVQAAPAQASSNNSFWWSAILTVGGALLSSGPAKGSVGNVPVLGKLPAKKHKPKLRTVHI